MPPLVCAYCTMMSKALLASAPPLMTSTIFCNSMNVSTSVPSSLVLSIALVINAMLASVTPVMPKPLSCSFVSVPPAMASMTAVTLFNKAWISLMVLTSPNTLRSITSLSSLVLAAKRATAFVLFGSTASKPLTPSKVY